jgi:hypothetical protein
MKMNINNAVPIKGGGVEGGVVSPSILWYENLVNFFKISKISQIYTS